MKPAFGKFLVFLLGVAVGAVLVVLFQKLSPRKRHEVPAPTKSTGVVAEDLDGDGAADAWHTYEKGVLKKSEIDTNFDGNADHRTQFLEEGRSRREIDADYDGSPDLWEDGENGVIVKSEYDRNHDGKADRWIHYRQGLRIREEEDRNGDGRPDRWVHYDATENPVKIEIDADNDGKPDNAQEPPR